MKVYIIRHGQTNANALGVIQGSSDFSRLTELGRIQASDAFQGVFLSNPRLSITSIYSSPLTRARETLQELRQKDTEQSVRGCLYTKEYIGRSVLPPKDTILENLREIDFYDWEGKGKEELETNFPESWQAWKEGDPNKLIVYETKKDGTRIERYPLFELWERADRVWDEIFYHEQRQQQQEKQQLQQGQASDTLTESNNEHCSLIVAHGSLGQALLGTAMGWNADQFRVHEFPNCGILEIKFSDVKSRSKTTVNQWKWVWPRG